VVILKYKEMLENIICQNSVKIRSKFGKNKAPSRQFVDSFVKRVRETGSLMDKTTRLRARPVRSVENIAAVAESVRRRQLCTVLKSWIFRALPCNGF